MEEGQQDVVATLLNDENKEWRWALVGNIVESHLFGEEKDVRYGTKQFAPGTKVYCSPHQWGDGWERIRVIGKPRHQRNLIMVVMPSKLIDNFRIQKVYSPTILQMIDDCGCSWWSSDEEGRQEIIFLMWSLEAAGFKVVRNAYWDDSNENG